MITYKKKQFAMKTGDNAGRRVGFSACLYKEMPLLHFPVFGRLAIGDRNKVICRIWRSSHDGPGDCKSP